MDSSKSAYLRADAKGARAVMKRGSWGLLLLLFVCLAAGSARAQQWPLTTDDVSVLLIGGASTQKMLKAIRARGVDFQMNPDLAKKFHDLGASDEVIEALQRASAKRAQAAAQSKPSAAKTSASAQAAGVKAPPETPPAPAKPAAQPAAASQPPASVNEKVGQVLAEKEKPLDVDAAQSSGEGSDEPPKAKASSKPAAAPDLSDPSPAEIQHIIQEFAAKEKLFKEARDNYTYHQINKVEELGPDDQVVGTYRQDWDILFDDSGKRIEQVTYAPLPTLKRLMVTEQDLDSMRNIQPFVLTTDELPEYDIKYLGHVKVDFLTTYVFSIRPQEIKKGRQYFKGVVWVDDRDLQIVKSEGRTVPELKTKRGENLFPRFTTYREQIDGKYWFPTYTAADDTLYFANGPVHIKEVIRYTNYKQFKSKVRILSSTPTGDTGTTSSKPPPKQ